MLKKQEFFISLLSILLELFFTPPEKQLVPEA